MEYCFLLKILTSFKTCFVLFCQLGIRGVFRSLTVFCVFGCFGWICVKRVFFCLFLWVVFVVGFSVAAGFWVFVWFFVWF